MSLRAQTGLQSEMATVIAGMTTSLDGFVVDADGSVGRLVVGGASVVQQLLRAGLVDELRIDVMGVMFGAGLRLFESLEPEQVRLEKIDVREVGARTSLRRVVKK